jgi:hypothetical protein
MSRMPRTSVLSPLRCLVIENKGLSEYSGLLVEFNNENLGIDASLYLVILIGLAP